MSGTKTVSTVDRVENTASVAGTGLDGNADGVFEVAASAAANRQRGSSPLLVDQP